MCAANEPAKEHDRTLLVFSALRHCLGSTSKVLPLGKSTDTLSLFSLPLRISLIV